MPTPRFLVSLLSIGFAFSCAGVATGQNYPAKPIRILTGSAGGAGDTGVRVIAQGIGPSLGQQVVVENRGGSQLITGEILAKAAPDGYTLLVSSNALWILPLMVSSVPYDVIKDFAPVTIPISAPNVLVVHPSVPVKSVKELIALAKARPGDLNYAAGGIGAPTHLAGELFNSMSKVKIVRINYKGSAPALNDLVAGHVQLMFAPGSVAPQIKAGRLRALGVTNASPSVLFPGIPTIASSGVPGYEATSVWGLVAPAKTPAAVINRLNQEVLLVLSKPDVKERLLNAGIEVVGNSPEAFASFIKGEIDRMGKVIKDAGIRDE